MSNELASLAQSLSAFNAAPASSTATPVVSGAPAVDPSLRDTIAAFNNATTAPAAKVARDHTTTIADLQRTAIRAGAQVVPAEPTAFTPPSSGIRDYLYQFSSGRLDLPTYRDSRLESDSLVAANAWLAQNPAMAKAALADPATKEALFNHFRALTAINRTPASPTERAEATRDLLSDWSRSAAAGKLVLELDRGQTPADVFRHFYTDKPTPQSVPPAAALDVLSKVVDSDYPDRTAAELLTTDEQRIYAALGGRDFVAFVKKHQPAYVARARSEKLLGKPLRDPAAVYDIDTRDRARLVPGATAPANPPPSEPALDIGPFTSISPFLLNLARAGTEAAAQEATYEAAFAESAAGRFGGVVGADIGRKLSSGSYKADAVSGLRTAFIDVPMAAMNLASMGLLARGVQGVSDLVETAGSKVYEAEKFYATNVFGDDPNYWSGRGSSIRKNWSSFWSGLGRTIHSDPLSTDSRTLDAIYSAYPLADADAKAEAAISHFNAHTAVADLLKNSQKVTQNVPLLGTVGRFFGLDNPAVRSQLATVTDNLLGLDDPGTFLVAASGLKALAHTLKTGAPLALKNVKDLPSALSEQRRLKTWKSLFTEEERKAIEQAPPAVSVAEHTLLADSILHQLSTLDDPTAARGIAQRLEKKLAAVPGLTPEQYAATAEAITTIKTEVSKHGTSSLTEPARQALITLGKPISHQSFFDSAFTLSGDVNRAHSAAFVAAAENYLRVQASTPTPQPLPTGPSKFTKLQTAARGALLAAERDALWSRQQARVLDLTDQVARTLDHEHTALTATHTRISQLRDQLASDWNRLISEEAAHFRTLELNGGVVHTANPLAATPAFAKIRDALTSGDESLLWGAANDATVIDAIQTPEWRGTWDHLRAELDRARGNPAVPDETVASHQKTLALAQDRLISATGEHQIVTERIADLQKKLTERRAARSAAKKELAKAEAEGEPLNPEDVGLEDDAPARANVPADVADAYTAALSLRDTAARQLKALKSSTEKGIARVRETEIGYWESQVKKHNATLADLSRQITGELTGNVPEDLAISLELRSLSSQKLRLSGELKNLTEQVDLTSNALAHAEVETTLGHRAPETVTADLSDAFLTRAREWYEEALRPAERQVAPAVKPRTELADALLDRVSALPPGEIVTLSKAELEALNSYRPDPFKTGNPPTARALRKHADGLAEEIKANRDSAKLVSDFRTKLASTRSDTTRLEIDPALRRLFESKLTVLDTLEPLERRALGRSTPTAIAHQLRHPDFDFIDGRYVSLLDELNGEGLSASEAFREALTDLREEHQQILADVLPLSSFEMSLMNQTRSGQAHLNQILRDAANTSTGYVNWVRFETAKWGRQLERRLSPAERQTLMRDIASGTPTTDTSAVLMQKMRRQLLDRMLQIGAVSPDFYHSLLKQDYYHGVFDRATRAQLADAAGKSPPVRASIPARFEPLLVDSHYFNFKIPEEAGTFYAVWEGAKGKLSHQTGFKSLAEAERFLTTLDPSVKRATIREAIPFDEKISMGLVADVGVSHMTLMEKMAHQIATHQLTSVMAKSGLVRSASEFPGLATDGVPMVQDAQGAKWYQVNRTKLPHLDGKYVHESAVKWLDETFVGYSYFRELSKLTDELLPVDGRSLSPWLRALGKTGQVMTAGLKSSYNLLALSKIAVAPRAYFQNWLTNIFDAWKAGIPLSAEGLSGVLDGIREYASLKLAGRSDTFYDGLIKRGSILPDTFKDEVTSRAGYDKIIRDIDASGWSSATGLKARLAHTDAQILEAARLGDRAREAQLQLDKAHLTNLLSDAVTSTSKGFLSRTLASIRDSVIDSSKHLASGKAQAKSILPKVWHFYQEAGLDNGMKYAVTRYLVERQGYSLDAALDSVEAYMQHLHRVPQSVKNFSGRFGGALFISFPMEQMRTLSNFVRYQPARAAKLFGSVAMWNSATLGANGIDEDEYFTTWAANHGWNRSGMTDTLAMYQGLLLPFARDSHRGMYSASLGPFLSDYMKPRSSFGRSLLRATFGGREDRGSAYLEAPLAAGIGLLSKTMGGEPGIQLVSALMSGRDTNGDPLRSPWDVSRMLSQQFLPDWTPGIGRDSATVVRLYSGNEVDPATHRHKGWLEFLGRRLFNVERLVSDDQALSGAIRLVQAHSRNLPTYGSNERFDDLRSTKVARGAVGPDGKVDRNRLLSIVEADLSENPATLPGLAGGPDIAQTVSKTMIEAAAEKASLPTLIRRFETLSVDDMVAAYAAFRQLRRNAASQYHEGLEARITRKLQRYSPAAADDLKNLVAWVDAYGKRTDLLPADLVQKLNAWAGAARYLPFKSIIER